jgi:hypothetical protein
MTLYLFSTIIVDHLRVTGERERRPFVNHNLRVIPAKFFASKLVFCSLVGKICDSVKLNLVHLNNFSRIFADHMLLVVLHSTFFVQLNGFTWKSEASGLLRAGTSASAIVHEWPADLWLG